jgi:hypothetical protein
MYSLPLSREARTATVAVVCYLALLWPLVGFQFGGGNNVEELPVIYRLAGLADYPQDAFVQSSLSTLSQGTPYFYLMSWGGRLWGQPGIVAQFLLLHLATATLLFLAWRRILQSLCSCSDVAVVLAILALVFLDKGTDAIPNGRFLFWNVMDPEALAFALAFTSLSWAIQSRWVTATFWLFWASLMHPLYTLPLLGAMIGPAAGPGPIRGADLASDGDALGSVAGGGHSLRHAAVGVGSAQPECPRGRITDLGDRSRSTAFLSPQVRRLVLSQCHLLSPDLGFAGGGVGSRALSSA